MSLLDDMMATVEGFYMAALGQSGWHQALDLLLHATGYTHASVYASNRLVRQAATTNFRLPVTGYWHNHDPAVQREYEAEYYKHEANRHYRLAHPDARVMHDALYGDERELDRSPFYAWAERVADLRYFLLGQTAPEQPVGAVIVLHRSRARGPTEAREIERFRPLLDHLERAVLVEHHMGGALDPGGGSLDVLERNPAGIVLLDGLGGVVAANRAARDIAAAADALTLGEAGIGALRACDDDRLQRLIGAAIDAGSGSRGGAMTLPRRTGRRAYAITVAPVPRRESILSSLMPAACVLITDPEADLSDSAARLSRTYGLTRMETRLVERLIAGDSTAQAAAALGILPSTLRTHLSAVFRKTETGRQQDLMRLAMSLPRWLG